MGLFTKRPFEISDVKSVVIIEQMQLYNDVTKRGYTYKPFNLDSYTNIVTHESVPAGVEYTFSVTLRNGDKHIVKERGGTAFCNQLLQISIDTTKSKSVKPAAAPASSPTSGDNASDLTPVRLQKNQISTGRYVIGKDIPSGTLNFTWITGNGYISIYENAECVASSKWLLHQAFGTYSGWARWLHFQLEDGMHLHISGNLVVEVTKSSTMCVSFD